MNSADRFYLNRMHQYGQHITTTLAKTDLPTFAANPVLQAAVTYWLLVIGEAAYVITSECQSKHPDLPWRGLHYTRNYILQNRLGLDPKILWNTATRRIPAVNAYLAALLA